MPLVIDNIGMTIGGIVKLETPANVTDITIEELAVVMNNIL
jgi:hypothetical protein